MEIHNYEKLKNSEASDLHILHWDDDTCIKTERLELNIHLPEYHQISLIMNDEVSDLLQQNNGKSAAIDERVSDLQLSVDDQRTTGVGNNSLVQEGNSGESLNESHKSINHETFIREIGYKVIRLHCCKNIKCNNCLETWEFLRWMNEPLKTKSLGDFLVSVGLVELLKKFVISETEGEDGRTDIWSSILTDLTDKSKDACVELMHINLHENIIERLKIGATKSAASSLELSILYKVVQVVETAREIFRELKIVELLQQFIQNRGEDYDLYFQSIILMAWVINEDENYIIENNDIFDYLEQQLKSSLEDESHRSCGGYKSTEILAVTNKLAVIDANKKRIIKSGILRLYASFLLPSCNSEEQYLAAQGLWTLSLYCPESVRKEIPCLKGLKSLLQCNKTHGNVKRQAKGALEELDDASPESSLSQENKGNSATPATKGGGKSEHIFISYQHGNTEIVHQVKDYLKSHGFEVWIDSERMSGSLSDDICDGIDSAYVVLAFLSQKYYESPYCKKELVYADENGKEIIPLTVEPRYKPHGWLSFRIADKLRIDFSGTEKFEDSWCSLHKKLREILGTKYERDDVFVIKPTVVKETSHQNTKAPANVKSTVSDVSSWTETEVKTWLKKHDLRKLEMYFDGYNGRMLLAYKSSLFKEAPENTTKDFLKCFSFKRLCKLKVAFTDL